MNSRRNSSLFEEYGRATFLGHLIEQKIISMVALWRVRGDVNNELLMDAEVSTLEKKPLAHLIKVGLREGAFSSEDVIALEEYRKLRNMLIHKLTDIIMFQMLTKNGCAEVASFMKGAANNFEYLYVTLSEEYFERFDLLGGDLAKIHAKTKDMVSKLSSKDTLWKNPDSSKSDEKELKQRRISLNQYLQLDEFLASYSPEPKDSNILTLEELLERLNALATRLDDGGMHEQ